MNFEVLIDMKKILLIIAVVSLVGCAERNEYEEAVLERMKTDQDIKDYKIDPEIMTKCVVATSSKKMPGIVPIDPMRREAYKNYVKMIQLDKSNDPKALLDELRTVFGSPKGLAEAHSNYSESVVECVSGLVTNEEKPK